MSDNNLINLAPEDLKINVTAAAEQYLKDKDVSAVTVSLVQVGGG